MTDILFTTEDMGVIHQALGLVAALDASKVLDDIMDCHAPIDSVMDALEGF